MKKVTVLSLVSILVFVVVAVAAMSYLEKTRPVAEKRDAPEKNPSVEIFVVKREDAELFLQSEGVVESLRETDLAVEVSGRVTFVDERFEVGGTFEAGEVILTIDETNYLAAKTQAQAAHADAQLALEQERARGAQAVRDWEKIGGGKAASALVLRRPFLKSAEARLASTQGALDKALEDLARTSVKAPYECRVRSARIDFGAIAMPGSPIGTIYDSSKYIVRLPFSLDDYASLPENVEVELFAGIGGKEYTWNSTVLWEDGDLDRTTLSAYVIAEFLPNDSYSKRFRLPPSGMFVKARVTGATLEQVIKVPRSAVRGRNEVWVMNRENLLEFRTLDIVRATAEAVYARAGVENEERVILNKLDLPVEGMKLEVSSGNPKS